MDPIPPVNASPTWNADHRTSNAQNEAQRLWETAQEFEGMFIGFLLKSMRGSVGSGGLFKEGMDTQIYREMFDQEVGRSIARAGGLGLAQIIIRDQALRQAGRQSGTADPAAEIAPGEGVTAGTKSALGGIHPSPLAPGKEIPKVLAPSRRNTE